ncbi:MAG: hypothetical protein P8J93_03345 [SAR86 cluster bacterium]|nr:hypothetical protein [SAR86 cluster bacterium]
MTDKDNSVLNLQSPYLFSEEYRFNLRLHDLGKLRLISLNIQDFVGDINALVLFQFLINSSYYQEVMFDHFTSSSNGYHGPFLIKNIDPVNFNELKKEFFQEVFFRALKQVKKDTPLIREEKTDKVRSLLKYLDVDNSLIFSLSNCNLFNRLESGQKYEDEWAHAINYFFEFILINLRDKKINCLYLVYE